MFSINSATGLIGIARFLDLNSVGFYTLTVRVTDSGFPPLMATASVRISLILSEYSSPKFSQKEYQAEVNEDKITWRYFVDDDLAKKSRLKSTTVLWLFR